MPFDGQTDRKKMNSFTDHIEVNVGDILSHARVFQKAVRIR
jgi:hypothetical protein